MTHINKKYYLILLNLKFSIPPKLNLIKSGASSNILIPIHTGFFKIFFTSKNILNKTISMKLILM